MPGVGSAWYPAASCEAQGQARQAELANSRVRLFKSSLSPTFETTLAELVAAEADYTGYPAGGEALAAWTTPVRSIEAGYQISSPAVQFVVDGTLPTSTNLIGGFFVVRNGGFLHMICQFPEVVPMEQPGAGFPILITEIFPAGG